MRSRLCWSCGITSNMTLVGSPVASVTNPYPAIDQVYALFQCDHCGVPSIGTTNVAADPSTSAEHAFRRALLNPNDTDFFHWIPQAGVGKSFPDVPEHIAAAASEAHACQSIAAHRAALLLARSVIEATAKEKGITSGNLFQKIDEMHTLRLIREHIKEGAHEVRHLGNDMAHGDFSEPVTREESALLLTLMDEVLAEVFQSPARVLRARTARQVKQRASDR